MSSDLHAADEAGNPQLRKKFKGEIARRRGANGDVRLSPLPAGNTLLTIFFFSVVALAIAYWIFFPPAATTPPETTAAPKSQPALRD